MAITFKELMQRTQARKVEEETIDAEIPEVEIVVESAINKFLKKAVAQQKLMARLEPAEEKKPRFVPVDSGASAVLRESDDEALVSIDIDDAEVPEDFVSDMETLEDFPEEDSESSLGHEITPLSRLAKLAIPEESESGLRNPNITLDESQSAAVTAMLDKQYSNLIGAAGTGKTTTTKELIHRLIYDELSTFEPKRNGKQLNIAMVAFTGMAVQVLKSVMPDWLQDCCKTIHSLLEYAPTEKIVVDKSTGLPKISMVFEPRRHRENKLFEDCLIIDESSMLGMELWDKLRAAAKTGTKVIMIGDLNQLPPIVGEPVFAYALGKWPVSELTHIHRQKGSAGKIVDCAHAILNGNRKEFVFDGMKDNPDWRVIGSNIDAKGDTAMKQILNTLNGLRSKKHMDGTPVYDPFRDRIMTAGNGYGLNGESTGDLVQQAPLNDALALMIQPSTLDNPRYVIDGGRAHRNFALGNRVMATKNEPPDTHNRVTNGMTGVIKIITVNDKYSGNPHDFGPEHEIRAHRRKQFGLELDDAMKNPSADLMDDMNMDIDMDALSDDLANRLSNAESDDDVAKADDSNWSSHTVVVEFVNGATREFWSKQQVESLQLAYASTVAKCQGSQFHTAIIIVHHAQRQALCREWLYTAITRAQERVIILYTNYALDYCFGKQKIKGKNLEEKVQRYMELLEGTGIMGGVMRRNVTLTVGEYNDVEES